MEHKSFDKRYRSRKRSHQKQQQQKLLDKYNDKDSREFWRTIDNIGIVNDSAIPLEVIESGAVVTDINIVLRKRQTDYCKLYNGDMINLMIITCGKWLTMSLIIRFLVRSMQAY